jgi:hypothetical protein
VSPDRPFPTHLTNKVSHVCHRGACAGNWRPLPSALLQHAPCALCHVVPPEILVPPLPFTKVNATSKEIMLLRGGSRGWAAPPYDPHVARPTTGWSHTHNHWIADAGATLIAVGANFCLLGVINVRARSRCCPPVVLGPPYGRATDTTHASAQLSITSNHDEHDGHDCSSTPRGRPRAQQLT